MYKYGFRSLKNRLFPISVPDSAKVEHNQMVIVRTEKGEEVVKVERIPECVMKKWGDQLPDAIPLVRVLSQRDSEIYEEIKLKEQEAYEKCNELIKTHSLPMRLIDTSYTFDRKKLTFYFTAPNRVDFRNLLKDLTQTFRKVRIDLRHIGVRDESSIVEGVGICGREFCCCSWIKQFASINIKLAKDQGMPINPSKISGVCGRLLCCLDYEYKTYIDAAAGMPPVGSGVMTPDGIGRVSSLHFLSGKVAVKLEDGKIKEFGKKDIEMIDEEVSNIEIDLPPNYHEEEDESVDISQLEDDEQSYTSNI
ncbi:MAG: regulatory iron-sulfur-containing complex subunit RicT [Candidatus Gastranaerophilales bacterium]|nr:regulatory iron-sulfur-containing complex subunit RicT [Candidatus Gastranaerophilales bacterium]